MEFVCLLHILASQLNYEHQLIYIYIYIYTCAGCFGRSLIISHAKRNFLSKVPESLKAKLVERLRLFSQEKQSSGT